MVANYIGLKITEKLKKKSPDEKSCLHLDHRRKGSGKNLQWLQIKCTAHRSEFCKDGRCTFHCRKCCKCEEELR